jgi:hypothetical protein
MKNEVTREFLDNKLKIFKLGYQECCSLFFDYEAIVRLAVYISKYLLVNNFMVHLSWQ